jgi:hypothetical protein
MRNLNILLLVGIVLLLSGCSGDSLTPTDPQQTTTDDSQIPQEVGDLLNKYALSDEELTPQAVLDGLDPIPPELVKDCDVFAVTFVWGSVFNTSPTENAITDWSGKLWVNGVAVVHPRRTIDFERGEDSILVSDIPAVAAWVSYTTGDFDGIHFLVFLKRDIIYITPPMLTFETGQTKLVFSFFQLTRLLAYYHLDNGQGVAVHARRLWENVCPGGLIEGRWIKEESFGGKGRFHGWWMDYLGNPTGYLNGIFWTNDDHTREFSGHASGLFTDHIIAEFRGHWFFDDPRMCPMCGEGHGGFRGKFKFLTNDGKTGILAGEFGDYSLPPDDLDMPFNGTWKVECPWVDIIDNGQ